MSFFSLIATAAPAASAAAAPAAANASAQPQGGGLMGMVPIIIIFVVMIFFMMRSQKKQREKRQEMLNRVAKGVRVLLGNGIFGTVSEVKENSCMVEIAPGVVIEVDKNGIAAAGSDLTIADEAKKA